jgi:hypothetical protein
MQLKHQFKLHAQDNDIKFSAHGPFLEYSKSKDWKIKRFKVLGAIKPKGLKRIAKIG